uniref:Uncharacterized protein n=1 Tax=Anguilla anguilla TaxID=7936 RepID=A0A0E9T427_ANGAN
MPQTMLPHISGCVNFHFHIYTSGYDNSVELEISLASVCLIN